MSALVFFSEGWGLKILIAGLLFALMAQNINRRTVVCADRDRYSHPAVNPQTIFR